jgi:acyl-coenzyme A thioesterase PaaI-like protein
MAPGIGAAFIAKGAVVKAGRRQIFTRADLYAEGDAGALKLIASGETILLPVEEAGGDTAAA